MGSYSKPVFIDYDKDDDLDVVAGQLRGRLITFTNNNGTFKQDTLPFYFVNVGWVSSPAFVDIDNDGDCDLFVAGETAGDTKFYINNAGTYSVDSSWIQNVTTPSNGTPVFADIDLDGDYDLVIGSLWGEIDCYENTGNKNLPVWKKNELYFAGKKRCIRSWLCDLMLMVNRNGDGEYNGLLTMKMLEADWCIRCKGTFQL